MTTHRNTLICVFILLFLSAPEFGRCLLAFSTRPRIVLQRANAHYYTRNQYRADNERTSLLLPTNNRLHIHVHIRHAAVLWDVLCYRFEWHNWKWADNGRRIQQTHSTHSPQCNISRHAIAMCSHSLHFHFCYCTVLTLITTAYKWNQFGAKQTTHTHMFDVRCAEHKRPSIELKSMFVYTNTLHIAYIETIINNNKYE